MLLEKKRIVITGATSGIGYEITKQLYPNNELVIIGRNSDKLSALAQEFKNIHTYQADLSKPEEIETVADSIVKQFGSIDLLVNNAAVQHTPTFLDDDFCYDSIAREIAINFTSVCRLSYLFLPVLLHDDEAAVLNINSGLGLVPKTSSAIYCGTKGALNLFSQSLRYQLEKTNVAVHQAFLPLVDTSMTQGRGKNKLSATQAASQIIGGIERGILDHDVGKVHFFRLLLRLAPSIVHRLLKNS